MLGVEAGWHRGSENCFAHVVPDDVLALRSALSAAKEAGRQIECEFRIINEAGGLRWLRLLPLIPLAPSVSVMPSLALASGVFRGYAQRRGFFTQPERPAVPTALWLRIPGSVCHG